MKVGTEGANTRRFTRQIDRPWLSDFLYRSKDIGCVNIHVRCRGCSVDRVDRVFFSSHCNKVRVAYGSVVQSAVRSYLTSFPRRARARACVSWARALTVEEEEASEEEEEDNSGTTTFFGECVLNHFLFLNIWIRITYLDKINVPCHTFVLNNRWQIGTHVLLERALYVYVYVTRTLILIVISTASYIKII